ncbi:sialate O-acetylesterase [Pedobacter hartonius]|uniref:Sialate O-acetylesterase domain-containing protein n=1 Tax=Pedobacter hartonius TaxID=425514 RepID=A0A1H4GI14_9SPHI|nr:sialate O-acetylesterase [Pedobacter hartonius]SEB09243.1 hypothetical protein SAMN05443550_11086 [Pedobacter hartonius]
MKKSIKYILLFGVGALAGITAERNKEYLINAQFIRDHWHFRKVISNQEAIIKADKTMIILAFGQSNSADYGEGTYTCRNEVYNYYKGDLYRAEEPLLGPDGSGCSVWSRIADMLIDSGLCNKVIIVPIGVGSTSIQRWTEGDCRKKLDKTLDELVKDRIQLTHILWDQGETDNVDGTSKAVYKARLNQLIKVIRDKGFKAPFYSSITSYFPYNNNYPLGINPHITGAQKEVINERADVLAGPNTDSLNLAYYRQNLVHFTEKGLDEFAHSWFEKIRDSK